MARSELEVIVKVAAREAVRELQRLETELEGGQKQAKSFGLRFTELKSAIDLGVGAIRTVGQVFQTAFDLGKEGAAIIQTRESFDTLLQSIGAAPDLLDQLTDAADGTVDQLTLMSSVATLTAGASDDVAQAMAGASPQLLEIARAASKLNPRLGDSAKLFEDIGVGIKRASPLILDNLGLTIKLGPAQERFAEAIGKTVGELTEEEKQLAILNDVLRAGNILIDQAGGNVQSLTDDFARFEVATKSLGDEIKTALAPVLADAVVATSGFVDINTRLLRLLNEGAITTDEYQGFLVGVNALLPSMRENTIKQVEALEKQIKGFEEATISTESYDRKLRTASEAIQQAELVSDGWNRELSDVKAGTSDAERATDAYSERMYALSRHYATTEGAADAFNRQLGRTVEDGARAAEIIRDLESPLEDFLEIVDTDLDSPIRSFIEDLQFLAVGGAEITEQVPRLLDELSERVIDGVITPQQAEEISGKLLAGFLQAKEEAGQIDFDEAVRNYSEALNVPVEEAKAALLADSPIVLAQQQLNAIDAKVARSEMVSLSEDAIPGIGTASEEMTSGVLANQEQIAAGFDGPINQALALDQAIRGIPTDITINAKVNVTGVGAGGVNLNLPIDDEGQQGGHFVVPPGYNHARRPFILALESGEEAFVLTRAQRTRATQAGGISGGGGGQAGGGGLVTNNFDVLITDAEAAQVFLAEARRLRFDRLNASMGG